ncbi:MAG: serine hydrolase [Casimicrobium sp.]
MKTLQTHAEQATQLIVTLIAAVLLATASASVSAQTPAAAAKTSASKIDRAAIQQLDRYYESLAEDKVFSGAVLIAQGDKVLLNNGYGYANIELNVPNTAETRFAIASITKQFTAAAILKLVDEGKLALTDTLQQVAPELLKSAPAEWKKITVRQLLDHTSGMANHTEFPKLESSVPLPLRGIINLVAAQPMKFMPGEKYRYNNSAYLIAGYLIEKKSGKTYDVFLKEAVLTPAGMHDSGFAFNEILIPKRASNYSQQGQTILNAQPVHMSIAQAAGGMYATAHDLFRWNRALYKGNLLSAASRNAMLDGGKHNYGLGISVEQTPAGLTYHHGGFMHGVSTMLRYEADRDVTIVVLSNFDFYSSAEAVKVVSKALQQPNINLWDELRSDHPLTAEQTAALSGRYEGELSGKGKAEVFVQRVNGIWLGLPSGRPAERLWVVNPMHLVAKSSLAEYKFSDDGAAKPMGLDVHLGNHIVKLSKQPKQDLSKVPLFLRGTMNNWDAKTRLTATGPDQYSVTININSGPHALKVASKDWQTLNLGWSGGFGAQASVGAEVSLSDRGGNLPIYFEETGKYEVKVDMRNFEKPTLLITRIRK